MSESKKYDTGKPRIDLIPMEGLTEIGRVMSHGAGKYGENTWQGLSDFENRYFAAAMRHMIAWKQGEKIDPESGISHLGHAATNIFFLIWGEKREKKNIFSFFENIFKKNLTS